MKTKTIAYWFCQILGWGIYSAAGALMGVSQVGWRPSMIAGYALFFVYSILLTHLLRHQIRSRQWLNLPVRASLPRIGLASLLTGTLQAILVVAFSYILTTHGPKSLTVRDLPSMALYINMVTALWSMIYVFSAFASRYRTAQYESLQLQLALKAAELKALEAQMHPHFLFNCLNTIRGMIVEDPAQAQDMLTKLADILRYSLQRDRSHTVALGREVEAVSNYLALETARFEDRLRVHFSIQPEVNDLPVPTMMLQTLVENAVKYGVAQRPEGGEVSIRAGLEKGGLTLEVENSGRLAPPRADGTQTGLRNVRERLRILYGDRAHLTLVNRDNNRVAATVIIPIAV